MAADPQTAEIPRRLRDRLIGWLQSLRVRALLVVVAVVLTPMLVVFLSSYFERGLGERMLSEVRSGADETIAILQLPPEAQVESADVEKKIDRIAHHHRVRVRVLDADGNVLVDASREGTSEIWKTISNIWYGRNGVPSLAAYDKTLGPIVSRTEFAEARARGSSYDCRTTAGGEQLVCHAVVWMPATETSPARIVYVQDGVPRAISALRDQSRQIFVLTLAVLPLAALLGWWLGWRFVKPIESMRAQLLLKASSAAPGADVDVGGRHDEFGDLTSAFNLLLEALQERRRQNEAFVADLAHEFKNPVAAIRGVAEALGPGSVDETRAARLRSLLMDSSRRLDGLLTQFLELARADAGMPTEPRQQVDVDAMAEGILASFSADERWKDLTFSLAKSGASAPAVPERLESAIRNIVDNAASFAKSKVAVTTFTHRGYVAIRIEDDGPGIAAEDLPHVFDRFFTRRQERRGTGLGLALVRAVMEGHGGSVTARSVPGEGATFELRLPARGDAAVTQTPLPSVPGASAASATTTAARRAAG